MTKKDEKTITFEKAFARLEEILEQMNEGTISLDVALKHFEEADQLIGTCGERLSEAEQKIETLIKNRKGELTLGLDQKPATGNFAPSSSNKGGQ